MMGAVATPRPDLLVLGGGIVGLACARELAAHGLRVEVIERSRPGGGASRAAAGMLAPLAEVPEPGPLFEACRDSRDRWPTWAAELESESGLDLDYDRSGALVPQLSRPGAGRDLLAAARELGEPAERVGRSELRRLVPDLAPEVEGALLLPGEHRVDNRRVCAALERSLARRGVALRAPAEVRRVRFSDGLAHLEGPGFRRSAPRLLVTAGAWSGTIDGLPPLPLRPVRGQMLALGGVRWPFAGSLRAGGLYAVRRAGERLLIGATVEEADFADHVTAAGLGRLTAFVEQLLPGLAERPVEETWSGLRPGTPDGRPILGRLPTPEAEAWIAAGHYRNGVLLAPWTAEAITEAVLGVISGEASRRLAAFSPERFASRAVTP